MEAASYVTFDEFGKHYDDVTAVLFNVFGEDIADQILKHYDWSLGHKFIQIEKSCMGAETTTTTTNLSILKDMKCFYESKILWHDAFDGDTTEHMQSMSTNYHIYNCDIILKGTRQSSYTSYKNTLDEDGVHTTASQNEITIQFNRRDFKNWKIIKYIT